MFLAGVVSILLDTRRALGDLQPNGVAIHKRGLQGSGAFGLHGIGLHLNAHGHRRLDLLAVGRRQRNAQQFVPEHIVGLSHTKRLRELCCVSRQLFGTHHLLGFVGAILVGFRIVL